MEIFIILALIIYITVKDVLDRRSQKEARDLSERSLRDAILNQERSTELLKDWMNKILVEDRSQSERLFRSLIGANEKAQQNLTIGYGKAVEDFATKMKETNEIYMRHLNELENKLMAGDLQKYRPATMVGPNEMAKIGEDITELREDVPIPLREGYKIQFERPDGKREELKIDGGS